MTMKNFLAIILLALFSVGSVAGPNQDIAKLNRFVQSQKVNTASMQIFREGRDFIEAQQWQKAAEKFNDFIKGYPRDKDLDAALYWYSYALQKQGMKEQAVPPLVQLMKRFPNSSWRREAEASLVVLGRKDLVDQRLEQDNCEIKILALQSLFQADEERAIGIVLESLKTNPPPCQGFQAAAVSMLGTHGSARAIPILLDIARNNPDTRLKLTAIQRLGDQHDEKVIEDLIKIYDADRTREVRGQILRALVNSRTPRGNAKVVEIARSSDDVGARQFALRFLGEMNDAASLDELIRIYDADKTREIRFQILRSLSEREEPRARAKLLEIARSGDTPEIRVEAIRRLSDRGAVALDDLLQLYNSETNVDIKRSLLRAFADNKDPRAQAKVLEIARSGESVEMRAYAIRVAGGRDDEQTVTQLVGMYDSEQNQQIKTMLLRAFGDSKQKVAVKKLMTIARNDPSVELRKLAVRFLGESKDPEALKFLEDLLK